MKKIDDLDLAALSTGLCKALTDEYGGDFEVIVQKFERTSEYPYTRGFTLSFAVKDQSAFERQFLERSVFGGIEAFADYQPSMTAEQFSAAAVRTATDTEVTYDVRPLQDRQQQGVAVFLGELVFRLGLKALPISKPIIIETDDSFEHTEQLDQHVEKLREAGLPVSFRIAQDVQALNG